MVTQREVGEVAAYCGSCSWLLAARGSDALRARSKRPRPGRSRRQLREILHSRGAGCEHKPGPLLSSLVPAAGLNAVVSSAETMNAPLLRGATQAFFLKRSAAFKARAMQFAAVFPVGSTSEFSVFAEMWLWPCFGWFRERVSFCPSRENSVRKEIRGNRNASTSSQVSKFCLSFCFSIRSVRESRAWQR